jgi:RNA polymerase sigma-70 factor (ECF subfamily)
MLPLMLLPPEKTGKKTGIDSDRVRDTYTQKGALVLRRCRMILRDEAAAEDAFQEVFIRLMRYGGKLVSDEVPLSWLYRTAERCCFDRMRKGCREVAVAPEILSDIVGVAGPEASIETVEIVLRYLHTLSDKLKQIAMLHYIDGLSQDQIAAEVGWSRRTVGKKMKQLKKHAEILKKRVDGK